jgi:hypothetical protein
VFGTKVYEDVGRLTVAGLEVPKTERNGYMLDEESSLDSISGLDSVLKGRIAVILEGNSAVGYNSVCHYLQVPSRTHLQLEVKTDTVNEFGVFVSLKDGATLKWDRDTLHESNLMITFSASKSWDGVGYVVPPRDYGENSILVKDDGAYSIGERDFENFPNDPNVRVSITATRYIKKILTSGSRQIQLYYEEYEFGGVIVFRKD